MIKATRNTTTVMNTVLLAIAPAALASLWFYGPGVIINLLLCCLTALTCEAGVSVLRGRSATSTFGDHSALVAAILLALSLPPIAPLWLPIIGTAFGIVIGKQLYGGLGQNPFNPAMVGFAALLIAFPLEMSQWPRAWSDTGLSLTDILAGTGNLPWDAISRATVLDAGNTALRAGLSLPASPLWQQPATWISLAWLVGGIYLLRQRIISWHIPAGLLIAITILASVFFIIDAERYASPLIHLLSGACMVGAFFIATDPVSAPAHVTARLVYGLCIGALLYIIRVWGSFPDGLAFAVLLMNLSAPALDHLWRGRS
jgi:electron transport complex protein RnfD